jgi:arylsulfatase A-like enzyme
MGMASRGQVPVGRGFASSLAYFQGMEDHYTQTQGGPIFCKGFVQDMPVLTDLWLDEGPANKLNGTDYSMNLYRDRALSIIEAHDAVAAPLFLMVAFANNHIPLQCPAQYVDKYPDPGENATQGEKDWRTYQGMITAVDTSVGAIINKLKGKGMYDDTLIVWFSDNGGPIYTGGGGNNYPLRGSKATDWEGGIRTVAMVSGGAVPAARRNSTYDGVVHVADWLATFAAAAGLPAQADAPAAAAGLPPFDSLSLLDAIQTGAPSPRTGKMTVVSTVNAQQYNPHGTPTVVAVMDQWKLICGSPGGALWTGPVFPNASGEPSTAQLEAAVVECGDPTKTKGAGCLFDVIADPSEHHDVAKQNPDVVAKMLALLKEDEKTWYNPDRGCSKKECNQACCDAAIAAGGFWAPYLP